LYYRLNVFPVAIPALRERPQDILPIARHFLQVHGARFARTGMVFSPAAEAALQAHAWPGNVRELENVIQRALIMAPGGEIGPDHLGLLPALRASARSVESPSAVEEKLGDNINMKDLEREHILRTLAEVGGSRKLAIERLGISERTLRYKLQQYREEGFFQD
jgi:two-component system response regulator FlrC